MLPSLGLKMAKFREFQGVLMPERSRAGTDITAFAQDNSAFRGVFVDIHHSFALSALAPWLGYHRYENLSAT